MKTPIPPPVPRPRKISVLVAEDNADDRLLLECAFAKAGVDVALTFVSDGQQVQDYLQNQPPFEDPASHQFPSLLLLDLHMPKVDGFEVLEWLRHQPKLGILAVVVYSGIDQRSAMTRARALGARHYLIKPQSLDQLVVMARSLGMFLQVLERSPSAAEPVVCR